VVGIQIWRAADARAKLNAAAEYEAAESLMRAGNAVGAYDALQKLADERRGGMSDLAALRSAEMDLAAGNRDIAIQNLKKLKSDGRTRDFRDLAAVKLAALIGDGMTPADFEKFMSDAASKNSPFYYSATLLIAEKYLAAGDENAARTWLDKILNDNNAPVSVATAAAALK
ncbi:MAG: tetratricopeptide repeat protein, partial [Rickettsiales bacterium]|nr:tetratricopeptide repeat protein [Rickettsiales bacterium]